MRTVLAAVLALVVAAPAFAAAPPPEAEAGLEAVRALLKSPKNASFRKVKVNAAGDVCATVSPSASSNDIPFLWTKASGVVWINESPDEPRSEFAYGADNLKRSTDRADYMTWKACQKG